MELKVIHLGDSKIDGIDDLIVPYHIGYYGENEDAICRATVKQLDSLAQDLQHEIYMCLNQPAKSLTRISRMITDRCRIFRHDISAGNLHIGIRLMNGKAVHELVLHAPQLPSRIWHRGRPIAIEKAIQAAG